MSTQTITSAELATLRARRDDLTVALDASAAAGLAITAVTDALAQRPARVTGAPRAVAAHLGNKLLPDSAPQRRRGAEQ